MKMEKVVGVASLQMVKGKDIENCKTLSIPVKDRADSLATLASRMVETIYQKKIDGLAATQVGVLAKMFVMNVSNNPGRVAIIFDPEYFHHGKVKRKRSRIEKCLSYPLQAWSVPRYKIIKVRYQNTDGGVIEKKFKGKDAILFQQLTDLCNGVTIKMVGKV